LRSSDQLFFDRITKLFTAVVCDALDHFGYRHQAMIGQIRPVYSEARIVGRARPLLSVPKPGFPVEKYQKEMEALDSTVPGDVFVYSTTNDHVSGVWGELLGTAAAAKGAAGAIVDGLTRDARRIQELRFPVFAGGISSYDSWGRSEVVGYDIPVECGGVQVNPGDYVLADYDGIVVIPPVAAEDVLAYAETKAGREKIVGTEFQKGRKVAEVFAEYGVL
jgi:regulator of RNase E activity RraA